MDLLEGQRMCWIFSVAPPDLSCTYTTLLCDAPSLPLVDFNTDKFSSKMCFHRHTTLPVEFLDQYSFSTATLDIFSARSFPCASQKRYFLIQQFFPPVLKFTNYTFCHCNLLLSLRLFYEVCFFKL